jgi:hypothetical protein
MSSTPGGSFNPTERMLKQFSGLWVLCFSAVAAWQQFHHHRHAAAIVLAVLAVTVGPLGLAWPQGIRPIFVGWMALAYPVGWLVSRIVLGAIFYGLFTPVAWTFRLIGRDLLGLKSQPAAATYWHSKPQVKDKAEYLHQF